MFGLFAKREKRVKPLVLGASPRPAVKAERPPSSPPAERHFRYDDSRPAYVSTKPMTRDEYRRHPLSRQVQEPTVLVSPTYMPTVDSYAATQDTGDFILGMALGAVMSSVASNAFDAISDTSSPSSDFSGGGGDFGGGGNTGEW